MNQNCLLSKIHHFPIVGINDIFHEMMNEPYSGMKKRRKFESGIWSKSIDMRSLPTKAEDLSVTLEQGVTVISGKSETQRESDGMKVKSNHVWSKEFNIPENIDPESLSVKLENEKLRICGKSKMKGIEIKIKKENTKTDEKGKIDEEKLEGK